MDEKAILVAELGINHQGDFDILCQMADTFLRYADYVKTQMRTPRICVPRDQWNKEKVWMGKTMTYIEYKESMEFNEAQYDEFNKLYNGKWFPSVWDLPSLELADKYALPYIKIPSAKITDLRLVAEAAKRFPIVISTGMSNWYQVEQAVNTAKQLSRDVTVLHCTSTYPVIDEEVNLRTIKTIKDRFNPSHVGFSSHSASPYPAIYSALMGAEFIEIHATMNRAWAGTDQSASIEPRGFELIDRELRRIPNLLGDGEIKVYESELEPMRKLRGDK